MDNISTAIKAIYELLKAELDIEVYLGYVGNDAVLPYVVIGSNDLMSNDTKTSTGYILELQTHIIADNMVEVLKYSAIARQLLHNQTFEASCVHACMHQSTMNFNEVKSQAGNEVILPQSIVKFHLIIE